MGARVGEETVAAGCHHFCECSRSIGWADHGRAVGSAGAAIAAGCQGGAATHPASAADRRHTDPGSHGCSVAGRPRRVPTVEPEPRSVSPMAAERHLAVEQGQKPMPIVITGGQRGDSPQFETVLKQVRVPRLGPGRAAHLPRSRARRQGMRLPQKPEPTCAAVAPAAPTRTRPTRRATARSVVPAVVGRPSSTPWTTSPGMPLSAASTVS